MSVISLQASWDIFCRVVDNFGDIGVCWRLARQLTAEHGIAVRLWVDDLDSFARLCPAIKRSEASQVVTGVTVCSWREPFPDVVPGTVVIEAFGCEIPASFKTSMAAKLPAPVWINLEHLSAEDWVTGTHGLPSPQALMNKYFFFPGFVAGAGGLLRERDLIARREQFQQNPKALEEFWQSLEMALPLAVELRVSLFCYDHPAVEMLFEQWAAAPSRVTCLVPEGVAVRALEKFFAAPSLGVNQLCTAGSLTVRVIPFLEQERYDRLLWACDFNFVRGEDSFVRAQWAARPFVWQIYPQHEDAHRIKLDAFLDLFCAAMEVNCARQVRSFWRGWNGAGLGATAWREALETRADFGCHVGRWSKSLALQTDLTTRLVNFSGVLLK